MQFIFSIKNIVSIFVLVIYISRYVLSYLSDAWKSQGIGLQQPTSMSPYIGVLALLAIAYSHKALLIL